MPFVDPPPYPDEPDEPAPFGGEPIDFDRLLRIYGKQMVRRWEFRGRDPHHHHHLHLRVHPDGKFSLQCTATRENRVWLFPTQAEAEQAAERMRAALRWPGEWSEISAT